MKGFGRYISLIFGLALLRPCIARAQDDLSYQAVPPAPSAAWRPAGRSIPEKLSRLMRDLRYRWIGVPWTNHPFIPEAQFVPLKGRRPRPVGSDEFIPVLNQSGQRTGFSTRSKVHLKGQWHPVVHVFLLTPQNLLYFYENPWKHRIFSFGGHALKSDPKTEDAAIREIFEETGLKMDPSRLLRITPFNGLAYKSHWESFQTRFSNNERGTDYVYLLNEQEEKSLPGTFANAEIEKGRLLRLPVAVLRTLIVDSKLWQHFGLPIQMLVRSGLIEQLNPQHIARRLAGRSA